MRFLFAQCIPSHFPHVRLGLKLTDEKLPPCSIAHGQNPKPMKSLNFLNYEEFKNQVLKSKTPSQQYFTVNPSRIQ